MATKRRAQQGNQHRASASIVWFEISADDLDRAKKFYKSMFDWKFTKLPTAINDYWRINTHGAKSAWMQKTIPLPCGR